MFYDFNLKVQNKKLMLKLGFDGAAIINSKSNNPFFFQGYELSPKTVKEMNRMVKEHEGDYLILHNPKQDVFRHAVEKGLVDGVSGLELVEGFDRFHYRKSWLDLLTSRYCRDNRVAVIFNFSSILKTFGFKRAVVFGRMRQNMFVCLKRGVPVMICSGAESEEELVSNAVLKSFGVLLGMNESQAKNALRFVQEKIMSRKLK